MNVDLVYVSTSSPAAATLNANGNFSLSSAFELRSARTGISVTLRVLCSFSTAMGKPVTVRPEPFDQAQDRLGA